jgi:hypothetical protein
MIFIWKSVKSFKQHISDMKIFRQSHDDIYQKEYRILGNMPQPGDINAAETRGGAKAIISTRRRSSLVPLWDIELPRGIQN